MSMIDGAVRRASAGGLDKPVATFAAVAAAAVMLLVPVDLLQNAVVQSGLADTIPYLAPPLGTKAKVGLALVAAGFAFGLVMSMMRCIDWLSKRRAPKAVEPQHEMEAAPRLRRRDRHPDAPPRAPLSAARDLGDPDEAPLELAVPAAKPVPAPVLEPEPWPFEEPASGTRHRRPSLIEILSEPAAPAPEDGPQADDDRFADRLRRIRPGHSADAEPEPVELEPAVQAASHPEPLPVEEPALAVEPEQAEVEPEASQPNEPEAPEPFEMPAQPSWMDVEEPAHVDAAAERRSRGRRWQDQADPESLHGLLIRLERAMERRASPPVANGGTSAAPELAFEEPMDNRLRSALENLKRFAPRAG